MTPKSAAMISEILHQDGYSTAFIGKNHNIPDRETSVSGPHGPWPATDHVPRVPLLADEGIQGRETGEHCS